MGKLILKKITAKDNRSMRPVWLNDGKKCEWIHRNIREFERIKMKLENLQYYVLGLCLDTGIEAKKWHTSTSTASNTDINW